MPNRNDSYNKFERRKNLMGEFFVDYDEESATLYEYNKSEYYFIKAK